MPRAWTKNSWFANWLQSTASSARPPRSAKFYSAEAPMGVADIMDRGPASRGPQAPLATITFYMSLIVVGSVAYDGVETPHGKVDRMLGGAATYIALASSFFTKTRIVAVVGEDFEEEDTALLASRGIDLTGVERVAGKTFFWAGKYSD